MIRSLLNGLPAWFVKNVFLETIFEGDLLGSKKGASAFFFPEF